MSSDVPASLPKLTSLSHGGGCACKISPADLGQVLRGLPAFADPRVLVGYDTSDDAAVVKLTEDLAAVATVDFFTPIVDDPYDFGRVAATNAISDIYAMGARPTFALSIIGFPVGKLPLEVMGEILRGGADKAREAGIAIVGGHSIDDPEPKYGLAVYGLVHPERAVRNSTARPGDVLVLTKPIGTGVISQGVKKGGTSEAELAGAIAAMTTLNRAASEAMVEAGPSAATDVTGFSLMGHLHEVVHASGLRARVRASSVPLLPGARRLADAGLVPGGSKRNAAHFGQWIDWAEGVDATTRTLLCDAQTSGGLLIAIPEARLAKLEAALAARGVVGAVIGACEEGAAGTIRVEA
jgi:selenide,water dikinase